MARLYKGNELVSAIAQPDRSVTENADGTMEGEVTWIIDASSVSPRAASQLAAESLPKVSGACSQCSPGDTHPDDERLECYERLIEYGAGNIITCKASYFGLWQPNKKIIDYKGNTSVVPINKHPNWESIAQYAVLDPIGLFIGFQDFEATDGDYVNLYGTSDYMVAGSSITVSYWMETQPIPRRVGTISDPSSEPGFPELPGVKDFLLINQTYRQIGSFYQISEEYLASGEEGWNTIIYQGE